jgi:hypothetical protein
MVTPKRARNPLLPEREQVACRTPSLQLRVIYWCEHRPLAFMTVKIWFHREVSTVDVAKALAGLAEHRQPATGCRAPLAHEAAASGLLSPELAAGISRVKGVNQLVFSLRQLVERRAKFRSAQTMLTAIPCERSATTRCWPCCLGSSPTAFDAALGRELDEMIQEARKMASQIRQSSDLWDLEHYLTQRRREIDCKYDYRYSQLTQVFGRLLRKATP